MRIRTFVIALTVTMSVAAAAGAADRLEKLQNTTPEERATAQTAIMKSKLDLTPEQRGKVADLNRKYAKKMEPVLKGPGGRFKKMRRFKELSEQKDAELKQVLSPAQFEKYLASKEEMRDRFENELAEKAGAK